ncbi:capsid [uncultured virus]|uniref:Capsid n=1 Tax=uncultured virus TaxID=340016 RepID=A0A2K9LSS7_9VIRU|nr:capsid [uncultured virus]
MAAVTITAPPRRVTVPTVRTVRRIVRDELKEELEVKLIDTSSGNITLTTTPAGTLVSGIGQGTDYYQRLATDVRCKRFYVRYGLLFNTASTDTTQSARIMLVMDTQSNGVAPTLSGSSPLGLFSNGPPGLADQRNQLTTNRYLVLHDETIWVSAAFRARHYGEFGVNLRNHINFNGTGTGVGNIISNSLYMVYWTDLGTNAATFLFNSRLWFTDA